MPTLRHVADESGRFCTHCGARLAREPADAPRGSDLAVGLLAAGGLITILFVWVKHGLDHWGATLITS